METLYKYKAFPNDLEKQEQMLENLKNDMIWYCNPTYFNDIFDTEIFLRKCRQYFPYRTLKEAVPESIMDREDIRRVEGALNGNIGILSLTTNCKSNTMWAYYGGEHKGFCLGFDFERKGERVLEGASGEQCIKVDYNNEFMEPEVLLDKEKWVEIFLRKSKEWERENEYRSVKNFYDVKNITQIIDTTIELFSALGKLNNINIENVNNSLRCIKELINNDYLANCIDKIKKEIAYIESEIGTEKEILDPDNMISYIKEQLNFKGELQKYPGRLSHVIFGYRMQPNEKLLIKNALKHKQAIHYSRVVPIPNTYLLTIEDEDFISRY